MEIINGVESTSSYIYDDDNRISVVTNGEVAIYYHYDSLGRVDYREITQDDAFVFFEYFYYSAAPSDDPDLNGTSAQISSYRILVGGYNFTYTYDNNGNITSVSDGTYTTSYVYDSANQLIRENNQAGNYTHTWTYDQAGNILNRKEYAYTTGTLGTPTDTVTYTYGDEQWRDLLTAYDGNTITYDNVGNPLSDGEWTYTWENGRQLASMTNGSTTWTYTYNADGMRISKTNGSTAYSYVYNGSQLSQMTVGNNTLTFTYDATGKPVTVTYNGTTYFYATSIQGDVFAIMDANAHTVVTYSYDAWGNLLSVTGDMANTLGAINPLRYRGYVYDTETGLYYLQSRYYDPAIGRFLNADGFVTTGQGFAGNNMFAYCGNNPVNRVDYGGESWLVAGLIVLGGLLVTCLTGCSSNNEPYGGAANCYAYAMNQEFDPVTHTTFEEKPQPGSFSGDPLTSDDIKNAHIKGEVDAVEEVIMSKVEADCAALGYYVREVKSPSYISYSGWVIALAYQSGGGYDYHFYKKQNSTIWTHKPGTGDIMQWDFSYGTITDPANCNRGKYDTFVGYYEIMPNIFQ